MTTNDLVFDTQVLLPPLHIHGKITSVEVGADKLTLIYGGSCNVPARLARWHNFLQFCGGSLDFGKLTMHQVDLTMIDASVDKWFD